MTNLIDSSSYSFFNHQNIHVGLSRKSSKFTPDSPPFDGPVYWMNQTHSNQIQWIDKNSPNITDDVDALLCSTPSLTLAVKWADCLPILLYLPTPDIPSKPHGIIASIHAGRRGSLSGITAAVLTELKHYSPSLNGLEVYLGPHISSDNYPISNSIHYNLKAANLRYIVMYCEDPIIYDSAKCTYSDSDFYSYRKGDTHHRNWAFIQLRP